MSGLYLHLSKRNDNVEQAAEASAAESDYTRGMRRAIDFRTLSGIMPTRFLLTRLTRSLAAVALVAASVACDDAGPTTPTETPTVAVDYTETFSGTLARNGAVTFPFTSASAGTATATLASLSPDGTVRVGFAMGTWNGQACQAIIANDNAFQFATLVGTIGSAGSLCMRIYDIGGLSATTGFTITVVHP